jgi:septal ring factor EnvC (AmiA/AmiB activator)
MKRFIPILFAALAFAADSPKPDSAALEKAKLSLEVATLKRDLANERFRSLQAEIARIRAEYPALEAAVKVAEKTLQDLQPKTANTQKGAEAGK